MPAALCAHCFRDPIISMALRTVSTSLRYARSVDWVRASYAARAEGRRFPALATAVALAPSAARVHIEVPQQVVSILKTADSYAAVPLTVVALGMLYQLTSMQSWDAIEAKQQLLEEHQEKLEAFAVEEPRYGGIYMKR